MAKKRATQPAAGDRKTAQYADQTVSTGSGGEVHQTASGDTPVLTTQQGIPVADDQNSLKVGSRGPTALEDFHFREKIFHFDHERIPERVVHARGFGAHGYFENHACAYYQGPDCAESWNLPMIGRDIRDTSQSWAQAAGLTDIA